MKDFAKSIVCNAKVGDKKTGNNIPDSQVNGPSAAEIREVAGRIYKTDMREDDLARAVSFELAKKYKTFQTNTHLMDMVKEVLSKFKIGNESLGEYMSKKPRVINEEKTGAEEFFKKLAKDGEERAEKDDKDIEKVGNQSPQDRLNQDLSIIKEKCREKGVSLSFSELVKELEKYGWDFNELRKLKLPVSIGNSASDDKFAYVMREFDEGKLKTPDGKVVTDPAQAKAIAYSESKKVENGLARARNAIKK